jgi:tRNA(Ile)-lysidine synthase
MARRALGPATLLAVHAVEAALTDADDALLVGCSGGADSLALAVAAAEVARRRELPIRGVVVDHALQPDSAAVSAGVVATLAGLGVPADVVRVHVASGGAGPEAAARSARYAALERLSAPGARDEGHAVTVLLGHTLDDQAETVLLGLGRGSGIRSLAGMAPRRGRFLRPFLSLRRASTAAVCREAGLAPWSDPHNGDPAYARVRVRNRVLPVLEAELGPGLAAALARTAELAREDADLLDALAAEQVPGPEPDCAALARLPAALRRRVLRNWLRAAGGLDLAAAHLRAVDRLITDWHGQRHVEVPGLTVRRVDGRLAAAATVEHRLPGAPGL